MTGNRLLANHNHDMELNIILNCVTRILIDSSEVARTNESWRYVSFYKYTHHCHVWLLSVHSCFGYCLYSILSSMTFIWNIRVPSAYILNVQCVSIISELLVSGTCGDWRTKLKKKMSEKTWYYCKRWLSRVQRSANSPQHSHIHISYCIVYSRFGINLPCRVELSSLAVSLKYILHVRRDHCVGDCLGMCPFGVYHNLSKLYTYNCLPLYDEFACYRHGTTLV